MLSLSHQHDIEASQVQWVEVTTIPFAADAMAYDDPQNQLSAKFSIPHAVAAALVRGRTDVTSFYPDQVAEADIRQLASKVTVQTEPQNVHASARLPISAGYYRHEERSPATGRDGYSAW